MGILAIVFLVAYFVWKCAQDAKEGWRTGGLAIKAREEGERHYYTYKGTFRVSDNKQVLLNRDPVTGDWIETEAKNLRNKRNISEIERQEALEKARLVGFPSAVPWTHIPKYKSNYLLKYKLERDVWKDVKTGRLLLMQYYGRCSNEEFYYYRDAETLELVRPADKELLREQYKKENGFNYYGDQYFNAMIKKFNKEQEKWNKQYDGIDIAYRRIFKSEDVSTLLCPSHFPELTDQDKANIIERWGKQRKGMEAKACKKCAATEWRWEPKQEETLYEYWEKDGILYYGPHWNEEKGEFVWDELAEREESKFYRIIPV